MTPSFGTLNTDWMSQICEARNRPTDQNIADDRPRQSEKSQDVVFWDTPFVPVVHDYWTEGHVVVRASATMAQCSQTFKRGNFRD